MVLLWLILQEQDKVLGHGELNNWDSSQFASEIEAMDLTLGALILEFHERFKALQRSWRSQKLDINLQIQSFSGGLFSSWYARVSTTTRVSIG